MATPSNGYARDGVPWSCKCSRKAQRSKSGLGFEKSCNAAPGMAAEIPLTAQKVRPQAGSYGEDAADVEAYSNRLTAFFLDTGAGLRRLF